VFNTSGTLPANFATLFSLTGSSLGSALTQIDGESATGAERSAFQLMTQFLGLMLDPFVAGRGSTGFGGQAVAFAPDEMANLPPDIALAYASVLKAPAPSFDQRWSVWGGAYGGSNIANGNAAAGSSNVTASTFGFAAGMDYHVTPNTIVGFALAGGGTNWGLATGFGNGRSDAMQAGVYGITHMGPAYVAGALAFTNNWFATSRSAAGGQFSANFAGQSYGARLESGYRFAVLPAFGVTPYAALQAQDFVTPSYSEADPMGTGFGLSYAAMSATDVRTELGARFDDPMLLAGKTPLILRARLAWAHDFVNNPSLNAAFQTLPGGSFTVNGAPIAQNSALTSLGAELFLTSSLSLLAKFDGEFANGSQTYAGSGTVRYSW
jgi:outer membrane autotransporter protein